MLRLRQQLTVNEVSSPMQILKRGREQEINCWDVQMAEPELLRQITGLTAVIA